MNTSRRALGSDATALAAAALDAAVKAIVCAQEAQEAEEEEGEEDDDGKVETEAQTDSCIRNRNANSVEASLYRAL